MPRPAVPAYALIEGYLRKVIATAKPGDPLPSEAKLCDRFGVSRMTARQAVQRLSTEGLLYRVSGSGTFVARPPVHRRMNALLSFSEEMRRRGLKPSSKLIESTVRNSSREEATALQLRPGDKVVSLQRIRLANDAPMAIENVVLPASCVPVLDTDLESGSLHDALDDIGRRPTYSRGQLIAQAADRKDAQLLGIPVGSSLLIEHRTIVDERDVPVEYTETRYIGSRYVFDVELSRMPDETATQLRRAPKPALTARAVSRH